MSLFGPTCCSGWSRNRKYANACIFCIESLILQFHPLLISFTRTQTQINTKVKQDQKHIWCFPLLVTSLLPPDWFQLITVISIKLMPTPNTAISLSASERMLISWPLCLKCNTHTHLQRHTQTHKHSPLLIKRHVISLGCLIASCTKHGIKCLLFQPVFQLSCVWQANIS